MSLVPDSLVPSILVRARSTLLQSVLLFSLLGLPVPILAFFPLARFLLLLLLFPLVQPDQVDPGILLLFREFTKEQNLLECPAEVVPM